MSKVTRARPVRARPTHKPGRTKLAGQQERKALRDQKIIELKADGWKLTEIGSELQLNHCTVSQILSGIRNEINANNKAAIEQMRNDARDRELAIINRWLPMALQPSRTRAVARIVDGKSCIVEELVPSPSAARAVELVLKAEERLAKLMGLNKEKPEDGGPKSFEELQLWIIRQTTGQLPPIKDMKGHVVEQEAEILELRGGGMEDEEP